MQLYCLNHTLSTSVLADSPPKQLFRLPVDPAYFPTQCTAARPSHYKVHPYGHSYPTSLWRDLSLTHRESRAGTTQGQNHTLTEIRWHLGIPSATCCMQEQPDWAAQHPMEPEFGHHQECTAGPQCLAPASSENPPPGFPT